MDSTLLMGLNTPCTQFDEVDEDGNPRWYWMEEFVKWTIPPAMPKKEKPYVPPPKLFAESVDGRDFSDDTLADIHVLLIERGLVIPRGFIKLEEQYELWEKFRRRNRTIGRKPPIQAIIWDLIGQRDTDAKTLAEASKQFIRKDPDERTGLPLVLTEEERAFREYSLGKIPEHVDVNDLIDIYNAHHFMMERYQYPHYWPPETKEGYRKRAAEKFRKVQEEDRRQHKLLLEELKRRQEVRRVVPLPMTQPGETKQLCDSCTKYYKYYTGRYY